MKTIIVYGPPACGKTRNAVRIAAFFGINHIVDDWNPKQHEITIGAIHLTNVRAPNEGIRCFEFSSLRLPASGSSGIVSSTPRFKHRFGPCERTKKGGAA